MNNICYIARHAVLTCQRHDIHSSKTHHQQSFLGKGRGQTREHYTVRPTWGMYRYTKSPTLSHNTDQLSLCPPHLSSVNALAIWGSSLRLWLLEVSTRHTVVLSPLSLQVLLGLGSGGLGWLGSCRGRHGAG